MELELSGRSALVTGSSRGIGRAIAELLYAEGCQVVLNGRTTEDLEKARDDLPGAVAVAAILRTVQRFFADDYTKRRVLFH